MGIKIATLHNGRRLYLALILLLLAAGAILPPLALGSTARAAACAPGTDRGQVSTAVNIPETKTYRVWSRMKVPDSNNNTYLLEIDGNQCITVGGPQSANQWNWIDFKDQNTGSKINVQLSKGQHSLKFIGNEPGVKLDRVVFVSDTNCKPSSATGEECDIPEDKTAPSVEITEPGAGKISGIQNVVAKASDNIGVTKVEFFVNSARRSIDTSSPYGFALNTTELKNDSYLLIVKAYDAAGNVSSDTIKVTVDNSGIAPPPPPSNVQSDPKSHEVTITWEETPEAIGYQIFRNGVPIATVGREARSYTDRDVIPNTEYDYRVSAISDSGFESVPSAKVETMTETVDDEDAPSEVSGLAAHAATSAQINLQWTASVDDVAVKLYDVYRATNGGEPQKIAEVSSTSFGDVGLLPATEYSYFVRARDTNNNTGTASETVKAKTKNTERRGVIYGAVKDAATNKALSRATITVTDREGRRHIYTASRKGGYVVRRLEAGSYNTSYRADGYKSTTISVRINDDVVRKDLKLEER